MKKLFAAVSADARQETFVPVTARRTPLVQRFIETGDPRCPLAGMWTLAVSDAQADDSERTRLAMGPLFLWRAFTLA